MLVKFSREVVIESDSVEEAMLAFGEIETSGNDIFARSIPWRTTRMEVAGNVRPDFVVQWEESQQVIRTNHDRSWLGWLTARMVFYCSYCHFEYPPESIVLVKLPSCLRRLQCRVCSHTVDYIGPLQEKDRWYTLVRPRRESVQDFSLLSLPIAQNYTK